MNWKTKTKGEKKSLGDRRNKLLWSYVKKIIK